MRKKYVFVQRKPYKAIEEEAETILEAKKKVKEMGYENMRFERIKVLGYGQEDKQENR